MRAWYIILFLAFCAAPPVRADAFAPPATGSVVHSIAFSGAARTSPQGLRAVLSSRVGQPLNSLHISRDIAALAALPDVHDVVVTAMPAASGIALTFALQEAPLIATLAATRDTPGRRLPRRPLKRLQTGQPFSPAALFDAAHAVQDYFHRHQFHSITVSSSVTRLSGTNLVAIALHAHEGQRQYISAVTIYGNHALSTRQLNGLLHCTPRNRWRFRNGAFQPAQFDTDRQRVLDAYLARGFLDARVAITARPAARSNEIAVTVSVFEGPQYTAGHLTWHARGLSSNQLAHIEQRISFDDDTPYTPQLPETIRARIAEVSRAANMPVPGIVVRTLIAPNSTPTQPVVAITISLAKPGLPLSAPQPALPYPLLRVTSF